MNKYFLVLFTLVIFSSCFIENNRATDISGVYVREVSGEFGKGWDTVFVSEQEVGSDRYTIRHHVQIIRMEKGMPETPTKKETVLSGAWNPDARQLAEQRLGRIYSFPQKDEMYLGSSRYERIDNH